MEPPAKRLRILQSLHVDEQNPEYIRAQKKAQARLKSSFEAIYSKFGALHEAQSDEIDVWTGKVVVDRGHLRRLDRHGSWDDILLGDSNQRAEEDADEDEDDRDELAPSASPQPETNPKIALQQNAVVEDKPVHGIAAPPTEDQTTPREEQRVQTNAAVAELESLLSKLSAVAATPTSNIPQQHSPQTPDVASLIQKIQTLSPVVTPLLTNWLNNTSVIQKQDPNANPISSPLAAVNAKKSPIPYQSPVSDDSELAKSIRTCPIPAPTSGLERTITASFDCSNPGQQQNKIQNNSAMAISARSVPFEYNGTRTGDPLVLSDNSARIPDQTAPHPTFTAEDMEHIFKMREQRNMTWRQVRDSQRKWQNCKWTVIREHSRKILSQRRAPRRLSPKVCIAINNCNRPERGQVSQIEAEDDSTHASNHLPTPESLRQAGEYDQVREDEEPRAGRTDTAPPSAQFDVDNHELPTLADNQNNLEGTPFQDVEMKTFIPGSDEDILPSIETDGGWGGELQVDLDTSMVDEECRTFFGSRTPLEQSSLLYMQPPSKEKPQRSRDLTNSSISTNDAKIDDFAIPTTPAKTQKTAKSLRNEQKSSLDKPKPVASHPADITAPDELQSSPTQIKQESSTPRPNLSLLPMHQRTHTPRSTPRKPQEQPASLSRSRGRKHFLNKVKHAWAKGSAKGSASVKKVHKIRSLPMLPMKKAWGDEDSADELGL